MSRRGVGLSALLVAIAAPAAAQDGDAMAVYREKTQAKITCRETAASDEIIVCGLREADKYRTPIVQRTPGDPAIVDVPAERERLIVKSTPCQDRGPLPDRLRHGRGFRQHRDRPRRGQACPADARALSAVQYVHQHRLADQSSPIRRAVRAPARPNAPALHG